MNDPNGKTLSWQYLLTETYRVYGERFGTFFRAALPPAILTYLLHYGEHLLILAAMRKNWLSFDSVRNLPLMAALGLIEFGMPWLLSTFFFAVVASQVVGNQDGNAPSLTNSYRLVRSRAGALITFGLASCVFTFIMERVIGGLALMTLLDHLPVRPGYLGVVIPFLLLQVAVAGIISRSGLAVPELMDSPGTSWTQSVRNSIKGSKGWGVFFMAFVVKSGLLLIAAYWLVGLAFDRLFARGLMNDAAYPWIIRAVYIGIAAAVESPLFIAFSVLYRELKLRNTPEWVLAPAPIG